MRYIVLILIGVLCCIIANSCKEVPTDNSRDVTQEIKSDYYQEQHRPQFHFSPEEKWMNDPNGMVYYAGEYHLFYQHYPDSNVWGPMHWGHAVSTDLVHWEHLPIALYPDSLGYIFSGSAVVDHNNTSGFKTGDESPIIAIYTYHDMKGANEGRNDYQTQGIAYSNDKGRSWTKYAGNPVIPNPGIKDFRDPKVIWDDGSEQWVMIFAAQDHSKLWGSKDLKSWEYLSDFGKEWGNHGGVWECPDIFPMKVEGTQEQKWVLIQSINPGGPNGGSATQYFVGEFDGKTFSLDERFATDVKNEQAVWIDYGRDNYAGVSWSDIPKDDGRRLFLGWMSNWDYATKVPTEVWRSAMTIPRELILKNTDEGYRISSIPVKELEGIREKSFEVAETALASSINLTQGLGIKPDQMEAILELELPEGYSGKTGVQLSNVNGDKYTIGFDGKTNQFYSDRTATGDKSFSDKYGSKIHTAPRQISDNILRLHLFFDLASVELFADDGAVVMTDIYFPSQPFSQINVFSEGEEVFLKGGKLFQLNQIWN